MVTRKVTHRFRKTSAAHPPSQEMSEEEEEALLAKFKMGKNTVSSGGGSGGAAGFFTRTWNYIIVYVTAMKWSVLETFTRHRKVNLEAMQKRSGSTAVITGGARGIGSEVVKQLLALDMHVIIGCRKESNGRKLAERLRDDGIQTGTIEVLSLDLNSFSSVKAFAKELLDRNIPINILINNAGIMFDPYQVTNDGFESHLQTNYLSHFLLTHLLLPLLEAGGSPYRASRVVNVSSVASFGGKINFDDLNMHKMYCKHMAYMSSKLMQVISAKDLNARFKADHIPVRVYSLHPGVVDSDLYNNVPIIKMFHCLLKPFFKTTEQGADGIVFVAISPDLENEGGDFYCNCQKQSPNPLVLDPSVQQRLWNVSQSLVGLKPKPNEDTIEITSLS